MKAVVLLSGGQDSTTCLFWAVNRFEEVHAVSFDYGQRHSIELESAIKVAEMAGVRSHEVIDVKGVLAPCLLLDPTQPLPTGPEQGVASTFVPMRNQLFLTIAANRAYTLAADTLVIGVSSVDYSGYPDCRGEFLYAFLSTCNYGTFTDEPGTRPALKLAAPVLNISKAESVLLALDIPGCYAALAYSHTDYNGQYPPGDNAASVLRAQGFEKAGVPDPLILRAYREGLLKDGLPQTRNYDGAVRRKYELLLEYGV